MSKDTALIEVLGKILSRLVNLALFIVISVLALVLLRDSSDMNLALLAVISIAIGVVGTIVIRYLFKLVLLIGDLFD